MTPKQILFVCTGNSCRSVMAQGLLQKRLKELEPQLREPVDVASAGVFAIDGMSPSRETLRLLAQEGVDMTAHMARGLSPDMARQAAMIFVMELFQLEEIVRRVPDVKDKVFLLKTFGLGDAAKRVDINIPDPISRPREVYEACFATIRDAVERVADAIVKSQSASGPGSSGPGSSGISA